MQNSGGVRGGGRRGKGLGGSGRSSPAGRMHADGSVSGSRTEQRYPCVLLRLWVGLGEQFLAGRTKVAVLVGATAPGRAVVKWGGMYYSLNSREVPGNQGVRKPLQANKVHARIWGGRIPWLCLY